MNCDMLQKIKTFFASISVDVFYLRHNDHENCSETTLTALTLAANKFTGQNAITYRFNFQDLLRTRPLVSLPCNYIISELNTFV